MTDFSKVWSIIGEDIQNIADDCGGNVPAAQLRIIIEEKVGVDPRTYVKYSDMLVRHKKLSPIGTKGLLFKFFDGKVESGSAKADEEAEVMAEVKRIAGLKA
jgi:cobalamin biosynthesis protein CbiD